MSVLPCFITFSSICTVSTCCSLTLTSITPAAIATSEFFFLALIDLNATSVANSMTFKLFTGLYKTLFISWCRTVENCKVGQETGNTRGGRRIFICSWPQACVGWLLRSVHGSIRIVSHRLNAFCSPRRHRVSCTRVMMCDDQRRLCSTRWSVNGNTCAADGDDDVTLNYRMTEY